jgi:hypothetical protein
VVFIVTTILSLREVIGPYFLFHILSGIHLTRSVGTLKDDGPSEERNPATVDLPAGIQ